MRPFRNPMMSDAEATLLIEQGYLDVDGLTPTEPFTPDPLDPLPDEDYTS